MSLIINKLKKKDFNEIGMTGKVVDMKKELNEFLNSLDINTDTLTIEDLTELYTDYKAKNKMIKACLNKDFETQKELHRLYESIKDARRQEKKLLGIKLSFC